MDEFQPTEEQRPQNTEEQKCQLTEEQIQRINENLERAKRIRISRSSPENTREKETVQPNKLMGSTRGGFLPSSSSEDPSNRQSLAKKLAESDSIIIYPLKDNPTCKHCGSLEIDSMLMRSYDVLVCANCRELYSDDYSLITKTAAKEIYLLTDEELSDKAVLPFTTKPNPYKTAWSDMQLYLKRHVREFAIGKWGSLDALNQEIEHRAGRKDILAERKFKKKLSDLRKRTRSASVSHERPVQKHRHEFKSTGQADGAVKKCSCGLEIEEEEI